MSGYMHIETRYWVVNEAGEVIPNGVNSEFFDNPDGAIAVAKELTAGGEPAAVEEEELYSLDCGYLWASEGFGE